jgi:hypothetical protein
MPHSKPSMKTKSNLLQACLGSRVHLVTAIGGTTLGVLPLPGGEGWVRAELVFPRFLVSRCALWSGVLGMLCLAFHAHGGSALPTADGPPSKVAEAIPLSQLGVRA